MINMFTVSRRELIAWVEGDLLHFRKGKGIAVNEIACEKAERLMTAGETIGLTVNGKIVTTMRLTDNGFEESRV